MYKQLKKEDIDKILKNVKNIEEFLNEGKRQIVFSDWDKRKVVLEYSEKRFTFSYYLLSLTLDSRKKYIILFGEVHQHLRNISENLRTSYYDIVNKILKKLIEHNNKILNSGETAIIMELSHTRMAKKLRETYPNYDWYFIYTKNRFNGSFYKKLSDYLSDMKTILIYVGLSHLGEVLQKIYEIGLKDITPK